MKDTKKQRIKLPWWLTTEKPSNYSRHKKRTSSPSMSWLFGAWKWSSTTRYPGRSYEIWRALTCNKQPMFGQGTSPRRFTFSPRSFLRNTDRGKSLPGPRYQHPFRLFGEVLASAPEGKGIRYGSLLTITARVVLHGSHGKMEKIGKWRLLAKGLPYAGHPWLLQMLQHPGSQQPQWQLAVQACTIGPRTESGKDWDVRLQHFVTPLAMSTKLLRPCWHISWRQCAVALSGSATKMPQCAWMPWASCTVFDQNYMESVGFPWSLLAFLTYTIFPANVIQVAFAVLLGPNLLRGGIWAANFKIIKQDKQKQRKTRKSEDSNGRTEKNCTEIPTRKRSESSCTFSGCARLNVTILLQML